MKTIHARSCALPMLAMVAMLLNGCLSPRYKMASGHAAPPSYLGLETRQEPLTLRLDTVIVYRGPGSWKREAFWDEYVVTVTNNRSEPLVLSAAELIGPAGVPLAPGADPWVLERQSKSLERKYADSGLAFVRNVGAGVTIAGAGAGGIAAVGVFSGAAGTIASATVVALPAYYLAVWAINSDRKAAIVTEFNRRRLELPLTLASGETRIGSFFFPMTPGPRGLHVRWSGGGGSGDLVLPLEPLRGLHLKTPAPSADRSQRTAAPAP